MGQAPIDAVLAGTKGFAVALLAPLTARIGTRPRVAADPAQVLQLCSGPSALAVIEFTGEGSLNAVRAIVRDGAGVRVVAGLPAAHASAEGTLRAMGVEVGAWDGKVEGVIAAVERTLAGMSGAAPAPPRPAAAPPPAAARPAVGPARSAPAAAAVPAPPRVARPAAAPTASPPRTASSAAVPAAPAAPRVAAPGAATAPPRVAAKPATGTAPAARPPGPAQLAAQPARPAAQASKPAAQPKPAAAAQPRGAPAAAPAAPQRPAAPAPGPTAAAQPAEPPIPIAPRAAPKPSSPTVAAAPPAARPSGPPVVATAAAVAPAPGAPAAKPRPATNFFEDLDQDVSVDMGEGGAPAQPLPAPAQRAPSVYVPPPAAAKSCWPSDIATPASAEAALLSALRGDANPDHPLQQLALRTLETLSELERAVLSGEPQPVDVAPVRKAAVMRLRVAEGLASAPAPGAAIDSAAVSAILGEIDALLAEVAPLLGGAPEELAPALESIRNSLVSEAIDFSEAASRVAGALAAAPAAPSRKAATARVIETYAGGQDKAPTRWGLWVVVALAVLGVGAYHVRSYIQSHQPVVYTSLPGAPAGYRLIERDGRRYLLTNPGELPDPPALEQFKAKQAQQGVEVLEVVPGTFVLRPASGGTK